MKTVSIGVSKAVSKVVLAGLLAGTTGGGAQNDEIDVEDKDNIREVEDDVLADDGDGVSTKERVDVEVVGVESEEVIEVVTPAPHEVTTTYEVTAYTAGVESTGKSAGDPAYGMTASGAYVQQGRTVACPVSIPFGTVLHIEGFGERVCEDRGSAIMEGRLDVYMDSVDEALGFGRQDVEVRVVN